MKKQIILKNFNDFKKDLIVFKDSDSDELGCSIERGGSSIETGGSNGCSIEIGGSLIDCSGPGNCNENNEFDHILEKLNSLEDKIIEINSINCQAYFNQNGISFGVLNSENCAPLCKQVICPDQCLIGISQLADQFVSCVIGGGSISCGTFVDNVNVFCTCSPLVL
jgi:hypothetical protein